MHIRDDPMSQEDSLNAYMQTLLLRSLRSVRKERQTWSGADGDRGRGCRSEGVKSSRVESSIEPRASSDKLVRLQVTVTSDMTDHRSLANTRKLLFPRARPPSQEACKASSGLKTSLGFAS
ncbi:uncharacterized protein L969DRAFT_52858 [Mixia osmundae IAM 14324]|uniref:Uncharacterized protein n=1 Tax=Mixia osmundae (strain CBS 9802 / IAM 14324 / JCM 22182 / KY 12970) TaxID=764103 RepID=G7EA52_MIXOS|nr:uncharacterized protein L969DRAFT_52858 [Mixia osmundae IAM 14324]KEI37610.1 hypothetical protein L969DRAFT_52858 [Mixia osmundae IAM 14324]GAA99712.1 hypothetical protein E5Q_06415 [Mixia osmundae IAM 14324]